MKKFVKFEFSIYAYTRTRTHIRPQNMTSTYAQQLALLRLAVLTLLYILSTPDTHVQDVKPKLVTKNLKNVIVYVKC